VTNNSYSDYVSSLYNGRIAWTAELGEYSDAFTCEVYVPSKPSIETQLLTNTTKSTTQLNGRVNPNNQQTTYQFDYGKTLKYGKQTRSSTLDAGKLTVDVKASLVNLEADTSYYYRLKASNASGTTFGRAKQFKTLASNPVLPGVTTGEASGESAIVLSATINPNGFDTSYYFEWGVNTSYGAKSSVSEIGSGSDDVIVETELTDLQPSTTYFYRIVAENDAGEIAGQDASFTTTPAVIATTIPVPVGQNFYQYLPPVEPVIDLSPSDAHPFAVGDLITGILNLQVGLEGFSEPVDIYLGFAFDTLPNEIFFVNSSNGLDASSVTGLVPWKTNHTSRIDRVSLYGDLPTASLQGGYSLYTIVVPTGVLTFEDYYFWYTHFNIY